MFHEQKVQARRTACDTDTTTHSVLENVRELTSRVRLKLFNWWQTQNWVESTQVISSHCFL